MARLSKGARKALPSKDFALPGRRFPVEDRAHARAAELDAKAAVRKGTITASQAKTVDRKAEAELHRTNKSR